MSQFEYQVIPAPRRGKKARGVKSSEERFAFALSELMNDMAAEGWEYQRADTLPCEERSGLRGRTTVYQNMLVFRRAVAAETAVGAVTEDFAPVAPVVAAPVVAPTQEPAEEPAAPEGESETAQIEAFIENFDDASHRAPSLPSAEDANALPSTAPAIDRTERS